MLLFVLSKCCLAGGEPLEGMEAFYIVYSDTLDFHQHYVDGSALST